jgi:hypothetical protein
MKTYFSKRHGDAIREKKLPLSFSMAIRTSIGRILNRFSVWGGFDGEYNQTFEQAEEALKTFYGLETLSAFGADNERVPADFEQMVVKGYPSEVLDGIEAWFDQEPREADECESELNDLFAMNQSPWRIVNGESILVDSAYLYQEVQAKTVRLLKEGHAFGALDEFQSALQDLQTGEHKDAVVKAHKSVESVMKVAVQTSEHLTFGQLLSKLIGSGIVPQYYEEFLKHFEKVALGAVKERNLPARGHGQGAAIVQVPRPLAEFAVNLAGSINLFIIECWLDSKRAKTKKQLKEPGYEDVPF